MLKLQEIDKMYHRLKDQKAPGSNAEMKHTQDLLHNLYENHKHINEYQYFMEGLRDLHELGWSSVAPTIFINHIKIFIIQYETYIKLWRLQKKEAVRPQTPPDRPDSPFLQSGDHVFDGNGNDLCTADNL